MPHSHGSGPARGDIRQSTTKMIAASQEQKTYWKSGATRRVPGAKSVIRFDSIILGLDFVDFAESHTKNQI